MSLDNLRFGKGCPQKINFPLTEMPNFESDMASPMVGNKHNLEDFPYDKYAEMLDEVSEVRKMVKMGKFPMSFIKRHFPESWGEYNLGDGFDILSMEGLSMSNPEGLAHVVHMDSPDDLFKAIQKWIKKNKIVKKSDKKYKHLDFYGNVLALNENLWDKLRTAIRRAFQAKYYFGAARPEEVTEELANIEGELITHYPEGCPTHPSYPAGHGAAAGATGKYVLDQYVLNHAQEKEVLCACYLWAQFRTFAGVHYAIDNLAGLKIGGLL